MEKFEQIERRWLARVDDVAVFSNKIKEPREIWQGYMPSSVPNSMICIRYTQHNNRAIAMIKEGKGLVRTIRQMEIQDKNFAKFLLENSVSLKKLRVEMDDDWFVDFMQDESLRGIVIVEKHFKEIPKNLEMPEWLLEWEEITDTTNNYDLATLGQYRNANHEEVIKFIKTPPAPIFVLEGGPGSGKSTVAMRLKKRRSNDFWIHKEMATNLILEMDHAPLIGNPQSLKTAKFEENLDQIQAILEMSAAKQASVYGKKAVIVDRGRPGIACYYPDYETRCAKLKDIYPIYKAVIILDLPPKDIWEKIQGNNDARHETYEQACALAENIEEPWLKDGHPPIIHIPFSDNMDNKVAGTEMAIDQILEYNEYLG